MKKYFITGTKEELKFGDCIQIDLEKKTKHKVKRVRSQVTFSELSLPMLIEIGAVEEREVGEESRLKSEPLDFEDMEPCEELTALTKKFEMLQERVDRLESHVEDMHRWSSAVAEKLPVLEDEIVLLKKRMLNVETSVKNCTQSKKK